MAVIKDRFDASQPKNQVYSDFLNDLTPHPVAKDLFRFIDENAINRSIRNLISTNRGERLYQPGIGSDINKLLFEPMSDAVGELITSLIENTISQHEPRAKVLNVKAVPNYDGNAYSVTIYYMIINKQDPVSLNVTLTRVR